MSMTYMDPRVFLILEMVLEEDTNTLEQFSNVLGVSTRTIRNYINQINRELKGGIAKIVKNEKGTYSIRIEDESKLIEIVNFNRGKLSNFINLNSPDERINYVLDILTMTNNPITIDDLAEEICIGRTTLIKDLKKADRILAEYDLELKRKPNIGMILVGEEMDIRLLILDRLYENYIDVLENVNQINLVKDYDIECLRDELKKLFKKEELYITEQVLRDVERYIIMSVLRNLNGYKFEKIDKRFEVIRCSDEYTLGLKLKALLEKIFNIVLNEKETIFLTMH
ncbi:BglG family transcription antiterminator [Clostridioides difficile]|uniref:BglG family transcription antiterminator n=1 Tax=Clostridioides difficile TaxID=1496 RepID=UPI003F8D7F4D